MSNISMNVHNTKELNITRVQYNGTYWLAVEIVDADGAKVELALMYDPLNPVRVKVIENEKRNTEHAADNFIRSLFTKDISQDARE